MIWLVFVLHSDANLVFAPETQQNLCGPPVALLNDIVQRYIGQAIKQIFQLLGAVDLFGNPMVLLKHWKTGGKRCAKVSERVYLSVHRSRYLPIRLHFICLSIFLLSSSKGLYLFIRLNRVYLPTCLPSFTYLPVSSLPVYVSFDDNLCLLPHNLTSIDAGIVCISRLFRFLCRRRCLFPQV